MKITFAIIFILGVMSAIELGYIRISFNKWPKYKDDMPLSTDPVQVRGWDQLTQEPKENPND